MSAVVTSRPKLINPCPEMNGAFLAQSVERTTLNRVVVGSIPTEGAFFCFFIVGGVVQENRLLFLFQH